MKAFTKTLLAAMLISVSSLAFADFTPEDLARNVTFYDVNKDGMITRTEWMKMAKERLDKMVAAGKMVDSKKAMAFLLQLQADSVSSGVMMSKDDMLKKAAEMFDKADTSKKGMLTKKQFESFLTELSKSNG
jgi:Ca2+-binding EF-hand superfamily protein